MKNRETKTLSQGYMHTIHLLNLTWCYLSRSLGRCKKFAEFKSRCCITSPVTIGGVHYRNKFIRVFSFIPLVTYSFRSTLFEVRDPQVSATWSCGAAEENQPILKASPIHLHSFLSKVWHEFCLTETVLKRLKITSHSWSNYSSFSGALLRWNLNNAGEKRSNDIVYKHTVILTRWLNGTAGCTLDPLILSNILIPV